MPTSEDGAVPYRHCDLCGEMFHHLNGNVTERYEVCEYCSARIANTIDEALKGSKRHEVWEALVAEELAQ